MWCIFIVRWALGACSSNCLHANVKYDCMDKRNVGGDWRELITASVEFRGAKHLADVFEVVFIWFSCVQEIFDSLVNVGSFKHPRNICSDDRLSSYFLNTVHL